MICNKINDSRENIKSNHHRVGEKGKVLCRFTQKNHLQYYSYLEHTSLLGRCQTPASLRFKFP